MRDAFGGIFMIRLFIVFIFIYVAFAAVSLNYAKAFRVKNAVISYIEENEIVDLRSLNNVEKLDAILEDANYNKECKSGNGTIKSVEGSNRGYCYNGIEIMIKQGYPTKVAGTNSNIIIYEVSTYAEWNLGVLTKILALGGQQAGENDYVDGGWKITGEAKVVSRK